VLRLLNRGDGAGAATDAGAGAGHPPWTALSVAQAAGRGADRGDRETRRARRARLEAALARLELYLLDRGFAGADVALEEAAGAGAGAGDGAGAGVGDGAGAHVRVVELRE
jgi:hypothetical protein